jgi:hypothetical protein
MNFTYGVIMKILEYVRRKILRIFYKVRFRSGPTFTVTTLRVERSKHSSLNLGMDTDLSLLHSIKTTLEAQQISYLIQMGVP